MKHTISILIFAAVLAFGTANAQQVSKNAVTPQKSQQTSTIKAENSDNSSKNILIHSIAFQKYNKVKYARISAKEFSIKKMQDTRDILMPVGENNSSDYSTTTTAYAGK